jgi:hypothetical protein
MINFFVITVFRTRYLPAFLAAAILNIPFKHNQSQNKANFITLGKISEQQKIEIIQKGFQLNQEDKISLKEYYQGTEC